MRAEFNTSGMNLSQKILQLLAQDNEDIEVASTEEERQRECTELAAKAEASKGSTLSAPPTNSSDG